MKLDGEHAFSAGREQVWAALHDPEALGAALPGARRLVAAGPDEYEVTVDVAVGSARGTCEGTFSLTDKIDNEACTVRANAAGRPGALTAVAQLRLADDERGTTLAYEADTTVTGPLANVGQRLVAAAARRTAEQFLAALDDRVAGRAPREDHGAGDEQIEAPAPGREIEPAGEPATGRVDGAGRRRAGPAVIAGGTLAGAALVLIGVGVGRWSARR